MWLHSRKCRLQLSKQPNALCSSRYTEKKKIKTKGGLLTQLCKRMGVITLQVVTLLLTPGLERSQRHAGSQAAERRRNTRCPAQTRLGKVGFRLPWPQAADQPGFQARFLHMAVMAAEEHPGPHLCAHRDSLKLLNRGLICYWEVTTIDASLIQSSGFYFTLAPGIFLVKLPTMLMAPVAD